MDYDAFIERFNERDIYSRGLGVRILGVSDGEASATLDFNENLSNYMGSMHGGALYTLADIVCGCAVMYRGRAPVTLDADIRYLRPVSCGWVKAHATEIRGGKNVCVIRADITDESGTLNCTCNVTMYLTDTLLSELR